MKYVKSLAIPFIVLLMFASIGDDTNEVTNVETVNKQEQLEKAVETCDGIEVTENCELDGQEYDLYKYYPAIEEKSHTETKTTYTTELYRYCTLCNDGTRSPSCSTGRGTCSHHGGVRQWNAPEYRKVAHYEEIKVIDSPAVPERYEIIESVD